MLHEVLSKEACAECRFCCSFRRQSLWEVPDIPLELMKKYPVDASGKQISYLIQENNGEKFAVTDLRNSYQTEDPEEEAACPFLDSKKGCTLPEEEKPFDCKIWPLRYMRMEDGTEAVCLTPTCPEINQVPPEKMKRLVEDGMGEKIRNYAREHPGMIKEYKEGFPVLQEISGK